ncbi:PD-(D/E)XK nuclease superfamily protein [Roseovarius tolerans]|uniref:PD-(D/E)XK nuclease superfamily protein n=1 Tax=Roseovarius tolerans TaxID=74031 RepID=A0A0L6CSH3_9RHOB|nr:double-strand break repair protein AddB [Roseovarius tolerans]KNX40666.1 PD-(D/E)XK nuclease superfamily protein [Roseovarius tolerans]
MFEPSDTPRVFGLAPGVDFPRALVEGLRARHAGQPPETLARATLIVNTRRMARRIRDLFDQGPPCLLPRISLVTDLGEMWDLAHIPDPVPRLRRRLELVQLISTLLDTQPDLAPRSAIFDLSDSLAGLMDEMHGEGVPPQVIEDLDVTDQSGHWARIKSFLGIVRHYFEADPENPDVETRQRLVIERLADLWALKPPQSPIIVAGSTGSRGATQLLMQAVARLPQGAVVLPGFDFDAPAHVWDALADPMTSEDHPQYRFVRFAQGAGIAPQDIAPWSDDTPPDPARNALVSLALRPAPVTDQWLRDGPNLRDLAPAMADVTLIEAQSTRTEALAIAMRLRQAAEDGQTAALITPDRTLSRQVTAALDRWHILPDDSAGQPLHLSPPGRLLRHVADLFRHPLSAEALLTLLKHPLTHQGAARNDHLRLTRDLELHLRRNGPPYPTRDSLTEWTAGKSDPFLADWVNWLCDCFTDRAQPDDAPLGTRVEAHVRLAERIAQGCVGDGSGTLWQKEAGQDALKLINSLRDEAGVAGTLNATDYASLFHSILSGEEVRDPTDPHPHILIWGTLEARVQGADLLILAGLNEGSWPEAPKPDPWLNRALRHQAGLLLPERRIGLSAHDFQQAVAAKEVWLTRSVRSDDAETVVSRWLNRVQNLLSGLPAQGGPEALTAMRARGQAWLDQVTALESPGEVPRAPRPAPAPPVAARPDRLSVTEIKRLIRDPYAIYARHVLRLRPLDPLMKLPDALLRGTVLHEILELFVKQALDHPDQNTREALLAIADTVLAQNVPWGEARALWLARLERVADWFIETEAERRTHATPARFEEGGRTEIPELGFALSATADRLDLDAHGRMYIYDYKTGTPPTAKEQKSFDKQLLLEAAMAERGGFGDIGPVKVMRAAFIGLGSSPKEVAAPLDEEPPDQIWSEFKELISAYSVPHKGYVARRAMHSSEDRGDYDQLARFGEWDVTDPPDESGVGQ